MISIIKGPRLTLNDFWLSHCEDDYYLCYITVYEIMKTFTFVIFASSWNYSPAVWCLIALGIIIDDKRKI